MAVVGINAIIGYVTESQSERTIHFLKNLVPPKILVVCDGKIVQINVQQLVPGDLMVLRPGHYVDAENGYFQLSLGGRKLVCRESLSELTSAVAMCRCDDKVVTRRVQQKVGLRVPEQIEAENGRLEEFFRHHPRIVVKPARGDRGPV